MITPSNIYKTVKDVFPLMLKSGNIFQFNGADHFRVEYGRMESLQMVKDERPAIFYHSVDPSGDMVAVSTCGRQKVVSFRCGVKCNEMSPPDGVAWQVNRLIDIFTPDTLFSIPFTFDYSGYSLSAESIAKLGIISCSVTGFQEYLDNDCNCAVTEMIGSFTFCFSKTLN